MSICREFYRPNHGKGIIYRVHVIDTVCGAGVLLDGGPDQWKGWDHGSIFGAWSLGWSKAHCALENQRGMLMWIKINTHTNNQLLPTHINSILYTHTHTHKLHQHIQLWLQCSFLLPWALFDLLDWYCDNVSMKITHGISPLDLHSKAFCLCLTSGTHLGAINHLP